MSAHLTARLTGPTARAEGGWGTRAACAGLTGAHIDPDVCAACTVWADCLEYALTTGVDDGTWGGLTARERASLWDHAGGFVGEAILAVGRVRAEDTARRQTKQRHPSSQRWRR